MEINNIEIEDNRLSEELSIDLIQKLCPYCGIEIQELSKQQPNLLVFPYCFDAIKDKLEKEFLFSLEGKKLRAGNLAGFIGINNIRININSRFDQSKKQYFIQYMLQKIYGTHLVDLKTESDREDINDYLIFLFPWALKKAINQGLFKAYRVFHYNDSKVKGTINFSEHIKRNIPYNGCIAYITREHSTNNHLTHLIRHTIEYINKHPVYSSILHADNNIRTAVSIIKQCTPDYDAQNLRNVIYKNLRPKSHPYYTDYTILQKLCLKILRHERLSAGVNENQINGVIFDIAWLWEEYLTTILTNIGFNHPQNQDSNNNTAFKIYDKRFEHSNLVNAIPDYYNNNRKIIIDAKYKELGNGLIRREDRFQIISYLHITKYSTGIIIHPIQGQETNYLEEGTLNGFGGKIGKLAVKIPSTAACFADFCQEMKSTEEKIKEIVLNI